MKHVQLFEEFIDTLEENLNEADSKLSVDDLVRVVRKLDGGSKTV